MYNYLNVMNSLMCFLFWKTCLFNEKDISLFIYLILKIVL